MYQVEVRARIEAFAIGFIEISSFRVYVAPMLMRKGHIRGASRLLAGLFAVQLVLTGFCLLTADAHAMPMPQMNAQQAADMDGMCAKSSAHSAKHDVHEHSGGCFHCDDADQFVKAGTADVAPASLVLLALSVLPDMPVLMAWDESSFDHTTTGPPGSASLLYTTTQRIRV
ncbi:MAG: hypothetical protein Q9M30_07310 [Mariprofundaceae bacterium]|nr:hypothetical protein [Mariprofundaceae bacterium]